MKQITRTGQVPSRLSQTDEGRPDIESGPDAPRSPFHRKHYDRVRRLPKRDFVVKCDHGEQLWLVDEGQPPICPDCGEFMKEYKL